MASVVEMIPKGVPRQAGTGVEEVRADRGQDALVEVRAAAVVADVVEADVERRDPEDLGLSEVGLGDPDAGLGRGHDHRPGVGEPQGRRQVDREPEVVRQRRRRRAASPGVQAGSGHPVGVAGTSAGAAGPSATTVGPRRAGRPGRLGGQRPGRRSDAGTGRLGRAGSGAEPGEQQAPATSMPRWIVPSIQSPPQQWIRDAITASAAPTWPDQGIYRPAAGGRG